MYLKPNTLSFFFSPREAKCLADQVEIYYNKPSERKLELLNNFTKRPQYFTHSDLIDEMNSLEIEAVPVEQKKLSFFVLIHSNCSC